MKTINSIIGLIGALTLLTACSDEDPENKDNAVFTITFSSGSIEQTTKSDINPDVPTDKEKMIHSCFIGFFELGDQGVPETMIKGEIYTPVNTAGEEYNYSVNNIILPENSIGKKVGVLVIANPPADKSYKTYSSYADFMNVETGEGIVSNRSPQFDPSNLVKVGYTTHDFFVEGRTAKVELRQLAAKVLIHFELEEKIKEEVSSIEIGGHDLIKIINDNKNKPGKPGILAILKEQFPGLSDKEIENLAMECNGSGHGFDVEGSHKAEGIQDADKGSSKWCVIRCDSVKIKNVSSWTLQNLQLTIDHITLNTPLIIPGNDFPTDNSGQINIPHQMNNDNILEYTFYTYRKPYTDVENDRLTVEVTGTLQDIVKTSKKINSGGKVHAVWVKGNTAVAWGQGDHFVQASGNIFGGNGWGDWTTEGDPILGDNRREETTYKAAINPERDNSSEGGLLPGYYYKVTAILKVNDSVDAGVNWVVVDIDEIVNDINIPSFD